MSELTTPSKYRQRGFSAVEFLVAAVVFGIITLGIFSAFSAVQRSYALARQLNEMYTVLSACPEIDRALEYNSLSDTANCSPNNTFLRENGLTGKRSYTPVLDVVQTNDPAFVASGDVLKNVPDSKIIDVTVGFPDKKTRPMELRMLVTRNGVGQQ
ncbi:prepilin-type N-terminal cleavage/methylation domain-containing protein [Candidatus Saccharibacteria bacterium]|jgi:prepilin-type N-terminal cleavage/methylation domain-containing protein|nr:prepilin-type N-terminal cleavage/methylation domain-containing protein [Candidatus Saccharibacteria bacterium]HPR09639.1 prepilin-type N-terminal cleavage/methylation domain-containing protein [Candidatus Saccharibacteria bacterium]